jgi:hypothetical protein
MKTLARRFLNLALWLTFSLMTATGLLLEFRLPPGRQGGHGLSVFGLTRHEWGDWHLVLGYIFLTLTAAHLFLAWPWLKKVAAKGKLLPVLGGIGVGLLVMLSPFAIPVERADPADHAHHEHEVAEPLHDPASSRHPGHFGRQGEDHGYGQGRGLGRGKNRAH